MLQIQYGKYKFPSLNNINQYLRRSGRTRTLVNSHWSCVWLISKKSHHPLSLSYAEFTRNGNNQEIFKINTLLHSAVVFEKPYAKRISANHIIVRVTTAVTVNLLLK